MSAVAPARPETAPATPAALAPRPSGAPRARRRALQPGGYLALVLATVVLGAPLVWMVLASMKTPAELYTVPLQWLPGSVNLDNYAQAADSIPLGRLLLNSVGITVVGAGLKVALGLTCAYALVFLDFPFKKVVFGLVIATLMIPPQITIIPNYTLVASLGWLNTYQGILVPGLASAFGTFLFRQHFLTLPRSILEAAELDGAGWWRRFGAITIPQIRPETFVVTLTCTVAALKVFGPIYVLTRGGPESSTLVPSYYSYLNFFDKSKVGYGAAVATVLTLVIIVVAVVILALQSRAERREQEGR